MGIHTRLLPGRMFHRLRVEIAIDELQSIQRECPLSQDYGLVDQRVTVRQLSLSVQQETRRRADIPGQEYSLNGIVTP